VTSPLVLSSNPALGIFMDFEARTKKGKIEREKSPFKAGLSYLGNLLEYFIISKKDGFEGLKKNLYDAVRSPISR
jgi:hypothetical protein